MFFVLVCITLISGVLEHLTIVTRGLLYIITLQHPCFCSWRCFEVIFPCYPCVVFLFSKSSKTSKKKKRSLVVCDLMWLLSSSVMSGVCVETARLYMRCLDLVTLVSEWWHFNGSSRSALSAWPCCQFDLPRALELFLYCYDGALKIFNIHVCVCSFRFFSHLPVKNNCIRFHLNVMSL